MISSPAFLEDGITKLALSVVLLSRSHLVLSEEGAQFANNIHLRHWKKLNENLLLATGCRKILKLMVTHCWVKNKRCYRGMLS